MYNLQFLWFDTGKGIIMSCGIVLTKGEGIPVHLIIVVTQTSSCLETQRLDWNYLFRYVDPKAPDLLLAVDSFNQISVKTLVSEQAIGFGGHCVKKQRNPVSQMQQMIKCWTRGKQIVKHLADVCHTSEKDF